MTKKSQSDSPSLYSSSDEIGATDEVAVNIRPLEEDDTTSTVEPSFDDIITPNETPDEDEGDTEVIEVMQHRQNTVVVTTVTDFGVAAVILALLYVASFITLVSLGVAVSVALSALTVQLGGVIVLGFFAFVIVPMVRGWIGGDKDDDA